MVSSEKNINSTKHNTAETGLRNEHLILSLLRKHGPLSQTQLRKLASMQSSTASSIVGRLREKQLILEEQGQSKKRGKKPVIVRINPMASPIIGIEINPGNVFLGLFDFNCKLIESVKAPIGQERKPATVLDILEMNLRGLLAKHNIPEQKLLGIGIALSGSISPEGIVTLASPLGWKDVPLREMVLSKFSAPVTIHTTKVRLLAEDYPENSNILYINVGNGVGGHVICDGHLIHGATNRHAEFGHIVMDPNGPTCGCGQKGCLETFISAPAIAEKIINDVTSGTKTTLTGSVSKNTINEDVIKAWAQAVDEGDRYAKKILDQFCRQIGWAAMIAINCYDPNVVMLAGYVIEKCYDHVEKAINERMKTQVYDYSARKIEIVKAKAGEKALITGVARAILSNT